MKDVALQIQISCQIGLQAKETLGEKKLKLKKNQRGTMSAAFGEICLHAMVKIQQKGASNNSGERGEFLE